jgi:hypothetical protein
MQQDANIELEYLIEKAKQREYKKQLKLNTGGTPVILETNPDAWNQSLKDTASVEFKVEL